MSNAYLWIDTETTGLKAYKQDIIQIACIPIINGIEQEPFNEYCQPINYETIQEEALRVHGISIEKMKTFQTSSILLTKFVSYLKQYKTKFIISGYNVFFDKDFIVAFFSKLGQSHIYQELFDNNIYDVYRRAKVLKKEIGLSDIKLKSLAKHFNVDLDNAHDALFDIRATIEIDKHLSSFLKEDSIIVEDKKKINQEFKKFPFLLESLFVSLVLLIVFQLFGEQQLYVFTNDSGAYLLNSIELKVPGDRTVFYSLWIWFLREIMGIQSLFPVVFLPFWMVVYGLILVVTHIILLVTQKQIQMVM
jgi:DNA polymerase III epsilon subunit-like protein